MTQWFHFGNEKKKKPEWERKIKNDQWLFNFSPQSLAKLRFFRHRKQQIVLQKSNKKLPLKISPRLPPPPPYHLHPALRLLRRSIRQEQRTKLALAIFLLAGGAAFGYVFFEKGNILATFGLVAVMVGLKVLWDLLQRPKVEDDRLWQLLHYQPRQIVWVYGMSTQTMPFGFYLWEQGTMYFKLLDGGEISISVPAHQLRMVSKFLNRLLPHASFGYSEERRQQFEADPASLLKK